MKRILLVAALVMFVVAPAAAQSLYLQPGERAVEVSAGWSVAPDSNGLETHVGVSLDGRWDVGLSFNHYEVFEEYAPFVRFFALKEAEGGAPVSLAVSAQLFLDDFPSDDDSGRFVQVGTTVYKSLKLSNRFEMQPFVGFAFVSESYAFGGEPAETARYLTRDIGLHFTTATDRPWILRATLLEQSFRRDTYRAIRLAFVRRL